MSFLSHFFHKKKKTESVVLIDIGTSSVAGAYARYGESELPDLFYTKRLPIERRESEPQEQTMLRALQILGDMLIREGAPILARATGSGSADTIFVSIDAPWQETSVRTELFEQKTPFVFTKTFITEALEETSGTASGKTIADESIIGTILNGYETRNPYGKKAHRVAVIILTSHIDEQVGTRITTTLQGVYHTRHITSIAGSSLRYQAIRAAFPHERDGLILDATGTLSSIALVRKGLLVSIVEVQVSQSDTADSWVERIVHELTELAKRFPLPRTIFLLARESEMDSLRHALNAANLGKLWLSDNPPNIVSVLASHLVGLVHQVAETAPDLLLLLMVIYYQHRVSAEKI